MFLKISTFILCLISFGCGSLTREVLKNECVYSIEGELAESGYIYKYVKDSEGWYFLSDDEKKELFNSTKINDCTDGKIPMEEKYKVGLKRNNKYSFEVNVELLSN